MSIEVHENSETEDNEEEVIPSTYRTIVAFFIQFIMINCVLVFWQFSLVPHGLMFDLRIVLVIYDIIMVIVMIVWSLNYYTTRLGQSAEAYYPFDERGDAAARIKVLMTYL